MGLSELHISTLRNKVMRTTLSHNAVMQLTLALSDRREKALRNYDESIQAGNNDEYWVDVLQGVAEASAWLEREKCRQ